MPNTTLNYYNQNAQTFSDSTLNVDMSALYAEFLPHVAQHGRILDAGCGSARDAAFFKAQGFAVSAFDASPELAELASSYLQQPVAVKTFQELNCVNQYDGIWCFKPQNALKPNGVFYVSFKYGDTERVHNGREFTDLTEQLLSDLINQHTQLSIIKHWQSVDQRPGRESEVWLNALLTHSKAKL